MHCAGYLFAFPTAFIPGRIVGGQEISLHVNNILVLYGIIAKRDQVKPPNNADRTVWKIDSRRLRGFNGARPFFPVESGAEPKNGGAETESPFPIHWACWHILKQQHALLAPKAPLQPNLDNLAELFMSQAR